MTDTPNSDAKSPPSSSNKKLKSTSRLLGNGSQITANVRRHSTPMAMKNMFSSTDETRISHGKIVYQIGTEIGRGAFGVVYQAFNVDTGDFVALKRFPITSIEDDQLAAIESEIELMQKLGHVNIVQYIRTIRSKNFLYIVMEYMENGSLSNVIKKFGAFSESLTAIYVFQVLSGLSYLHEQGVLHRDIKGANILTTKDGQVKLADFGVAIRLSEGSNEGLEVVGSPYWIAPEVIEMSTPTASCDIWSVGCLVIELLTGRPPYHDLAPLAAMFHIVQDDLPPFPKGMSDVVKDFLLLCFHKDPLLRPSARSLMMHPWLQNPSSVASIQESELEESVSGLESSVANTIRMFRKTSTHNTPHRGEHEPSAYPGIAMNTAYADDGLGFTEHDDHHDSVDMMNVASYNRSKPPTPSSSSTARDKNLWVSPGSRSPAQYPAGNNNHQRQAKNRNFPLDSPINTNNNFFEFADMVNESTDEVHVMPHTISNALSSTASKSSSNPAKSADKHHQKQPRLSSSPPLALHQPSHPPRDYTSSNNALLLSIPRYEYSHSSSVTSTEPDLESDLDDSNGSRHRHSDTSSTDHQSLSNPNSTHGSTSTSEPYRHSEGSDAMLFDPEHGIISTNVTIDDVMMNEPDLALLPDSYDENEKLFSVQPSPASSPSHHNRSPRKDNTSILGSLLSPTKKTRSTSNSSNQKKASGFFFKAAISPRARTRVNIPRTSPFPNSRSPSNASSSRAESNHRSHKLSPSPDGNLRRNTSNSNMSNRSTASFSRTPLTRDWSNSSTGGKPDPELREAKELYRVISQMKVNTPEKNLMVLCDQLIHLIDQNPELALNLVTIYGFTSLVDLIDVRDAVTGDVTGELRQPILCLMNKIMENNYRVQEQLAAIGIIPKLIHIVDVACLNEIKSTATASESITASLGVLWPTAFPAPVVKFDAIAIEAARSLYLFASASNTVQGLLISGGLQVLVDMISIGSHIIRPNPIKNLLTTMVTTSSHRNRSLDVFRCRTNGSPDKHVHQSLADRWQHPFHFTPDLSSSISDLSTISVDAKQMTYLGIDIIIKVCREPSSLKKEYCCLFAKYGLLHHLAGSFFHILTLYHQAFVSNMALNMNQYHSENTSAQSSLHSISSSTNSHDLHDDETRGSPSPNYPNDADQTQECKFSFAIANIFYNYSRFDTLMAEILSKYEPGTVLWVILVFLSSPELRAPPLNIISTSSNTTGSTFSYFDTVEYLQAATRPVVKDTPSNSHDHDSMATLSGLAGAMGLHHHTSRHKPTENSSSDNRHHDPLTTTIQLSKPYLEIILLMLRTLKNLSAEPSTLFNLERAGTIPTLVPLLNGPLNEKCKNQVIACIYNLCRVNKRRQEQAAVHGIIPYLQAIINRDKDNTSPLSSSTHHTRTKQYVYPLLCSLAHASNASRAELWKCDAVPTFLDLLKESYWQAYAFNALVTWMAHDADHVQVVLIEAENLHKLVEFFCMASAQTFRSIHQPLVDMMLKSMPLCRALGGSGLFTSCLIRRLQGSEAMTLCSLLRIIQLLYQAHTNPKRFIADYNLYQVVHHYTQSEGQVLVYQMASRLLLDFQMSGSI